MNGIFDGQVALVTGASRGIGKAVALTLAKRGCTVVGTATTGAGAEGISAALAETGAPGHGCVVNVADPVSVERLGEFLENQSLVPAILVNNAGITRDNLLLRMKDEEWDSVISTDLSSVYRVTKLCLRGMVKARHGRIINITSVVALSGNAGQVNYASAKAGIIGFTRSLAREVGSRGITVNAVAPGYIGTDMTAELGEAQKQQLAAQIPLGRMGNVEEIAEVVVFLASPYASYITGETVNVNGGMYMA